jgi:hypothetical protein
MFIFAMTDDYISTIIFLLGGNVAFAVGTRLLRKTGGNQNTLKIYSIGFVLSSFFLVLNYFYFFDFSTSTLTLTKDAKLYQELASLIVSKRSVQGISINYIGYPLILAILYAFFVESYFLGVLLNLFAFSMSMVLLRNLTLLVFSEELNKNTLANYAMLLFILVPYIVRNSTLLVKDSLIVFSFLLITLQIIKYKVLGFEKIDVLKLISGIFILGMLRATYLIIVPLLYVFINGFPDVKKTLNFVIISFITLFVLIFSFKFSTHDLNVNDLSRTFIVRESLVDNVKGSTINSLIGANYKNKGAIDKIKLLPVTTAIQVLFPFPFSSRGDMGDSPPVYIYSVKCNFIWYFVFMLIVFYFVFVGNKYGNTLLHRLMIFGGLFYLLPAFTEGGITPRYATPFIALLLVGGALSLHLILHNTFFLNRFRFLIVFILFSFVPVFVFLKG